MAFAVNLNLRSAAVLLLTLPAQASDLTSSPGKAMAAEAAAPNSQNQSIIDAVAFGVRCDGAADDTAAIQRALDSAAPPPYGNWSTAGAFILLPQGTCKINKTLKLYAGETLSGRSNYATTVTLAQGHVFDIFSILGPDVELRDMRVEDYAKPTSSSEFFVVKDNATVASQATGLTLRNLRFVGTISGVYSKSSQFRAMDVRLFGRKTLGRGFVLDLGSNEVTEITGGVVQHFATGVEIDSGAAFDLREMVIMNNGTALLVKPSKGKTVKAIRAIGTWFDSSSSDGVRLDGSDSLIARVNINGSWIASAAGHGIVARGQVQGIHITGSDIFDNRLDGIHLIGKEGGYSPDMKGATISGNQLAGNYGSGISVGSGITGASITGNTIGPAADFGANRKYGVMFTNSATNVGTLINGNNFYGQKSASGISTAMSSHATGACSLVTANLGWLEKSGPAVAAC